MSAPLRLLILTPEYRSCGGGIGTYYRSLLPALVRANCEVRVIEGSAFTSSGSSDAVVLDGVLVETLEAQRLREWETRVPALEATPTLARAVAASWAMWEQASAGAGADVIEVTDFGLPFVAPLMNSEIPVIIQMHGSQGQIGQHDPVDCERLDAALALALETWAGTRAAEVQSPSHSNAGYWAQQMQREIVCRRPAWSSLLDCGQPNLSGRISVFGRVQRWKGPEILCRAAELLGSDCPPVDWYGRDTTFESNGQTCSAWLRLNSPHTWGTRITWHGPVPQQQVAGIQSRSLLNLVPSTWDVFNLSAIEAMASGRPVVCSSAAGASELISDGVTGFIYHDNDPAALAAAIGRALSLTDAQMRRMGVAASEAVTQALDPERIARERVDAYCHALSKSVVQERCVPDWVRNLCTPERREPACDYTFLNQHPLKSVARYVLQRASRKLTGWHDIPFLSK